MKILPNLLVFLVFITACKNKEAAVITSSDIADQFVNTFYSFDQDSMQSVLADAGESTKGILFYQKWAECGNYKVLERGRYIIKADSLVVAPVTVKDDLIGALNVGMNVTDTFHLSIRDGRIVSVKTSSNDPPVFHEAMEWVRQNRADYMTACSGETPDPCECVKGTVRGFGEFREAKEKNQSAQ